MAKPKWFCIALSRSLTGHEYLSIIKCSGYSCKQIDEFRGLRTPNSLVNVIRRNWHRPMEPRFRRYAQKLMTQPVYVAAYWLTQSEWPSGLSEKLATAVDDYVRTWELTGLQMAVMLRKQGISGRQFATVLGVCHTTVYRMKRIKTQLPLRVVDALRECIGLEQYLTLIEDIQNGDLRRYARSSNSGTIRLEPESRGRAIEHTTEL